MNILQICLRVPYPPSDGGNIAMYNLAKGMHDSGHSIYILAVNTPKHFVEQIPEELKKIATVDTVFIDTKINPVEAFKNLFSSQSYNISRFYSVEFEDKLIEILKNNSFDIIQLESLFVTPYFEVIKDHSNSPVVLRAHNLEHDIWERITENEKQVLKKKYLKTLTQKLKNYEYKTIKKLNAVVAITEKDKEEFIKINPDLKVHVSPVGLDPDDYKILNLKTEFALFHLGSMDWLPNIEGVEWMLQNVWPLIKKQNLKLYLAGRKMPDQFLDLNEENIIVEGAIENNKQYMREKEIMLVPLLSGSGMRVKIIEGLALGKIIISTTKGAEGIDYSDGKDILIADTPGQFAEKINYLNKNRDFCEEIKINARKLFLEKYSYKNIAEDLIQFYKTL